MEKACKRVVPDNSAVSATPPQPKPRLTMNRVLLVLGFVLLAVVVNTFVQTYNDRRDRAAVAALLAAAQPYKAEVEKALRSGAPMPAPVALSRQAGTMSVRPDGTIVMEITVEPASGGRVTFRPEGPHKDEYLWTCLGEKMRPVLLPGACRP